MEGDSLGNDGTAIVLFYFIAMPWMISGTFDFNTIPLIAIKVFGISTGIGFIIGYTGYLLLKQFNERYSEFLITVATVYVAFVIAEWIHVAGVFALIVSGMTLNTLMLKDIYKAKKEAIEDMHNSGDKKILKRSLFSNFKLFKKVAITEEGHKDTVNLVGDFGFISITILFVALSELIEVSILIKYWKEILFFLIISTISRGITIGLFVGLSKYTKLAKIGINGWVLLTLAGIKGGISIIMLYSIPNNYPLIEMFEAIVMGLIISTIFIYGISLIFYINWREKRINQ